MYKESFNLEVKRTLIKKLNDKGLHGMSVKDRIAMDRLNVRIEEIHKYLHLPLHDKTEKMKHDRYTACIMGRQRSRIQQKL